MRTIFTTSLGAEGTERAERTRLRRREPDDCQTKNADLKPQRAQRGGAAIKGGDADKESAAQSRYIGV